MKKNDDLFSKPKTRKNHNPRMKYIILSFSLFVVILAVFSAFVFMRGIDFDLSNIVDRTSEEPTGELTDITTQNYTVSSLKGKNDYLFLLTDSNSDANFGFVIKADFDCKKISVYSFDASAITSAGKSYAQIYNDSYSVGLIAQLNADFSASIEKYIICSPVQFKDIIALFGGVTVNVIDAVDYKSSDFNISLDKGMQKLSNEYTYKYMLVSDDAGRARIMCDILNSVLTPEYSEKSDVLFEKFCNNSNTNISIIDYSKASESLRIYSNAEDKFLPSAS